jgi:hypothetical protein
MRTYNYSGKQEKRDKILPTHNMSTRNKTQYLRLKKAWQNGGKPYWESPKEERGVERTDPQGK